MARANSASKSYMSLILDAGHAFRMPQLAGDRDVDTVQRVFKCAALATAECAPQLRVLAGEQGVPCRAACCNHAPREHNKTSHTSAGA